MKNIISIWLIAAISLFIVSTPTQAQQSIFDVSSSSLFSNDDEFLKVDEAFIFNFHQQDNQLSITFDIAEGYYLYRHQFKVSGQDVSFEPLDLPQGIEHEDEFFGVQQIYTEPLTFIINIKEAKKDALLTLSYQGCAKKGLCYPPERKKIQLNKVDANSASSANVLSAIANEPASTQVPQTVENKSEQHQLVDMLKQDSVLLTLLAFFVGGLLLSFTPCVFPMYPILTGIIVGQGKQLTSKKAFSLSFVYVQGMAVTYTILGIVVAMAGAKFQAVFQHPVVLISLSALFIFLALSMFGVFNLALPASWQEKLNNLSNKQKGGSYSGVLMMGVISGLVASPCTTAPLTGALLYISQTGDVLLGASALYALSLGMGLPLLVLGSSGGKLLPKAGAWMNIIKNIFGLLLLAVPIFLLDRLIPALASEILWSILLLATGGYFFVANQASKNVNNFGYGLRAVIIFVLIFYGANKLYQTVFPSSQVIAQVEQAHINFTKVITLDELHQTVADANQQGKTVMVDLYADWCIACKEFEKYTFVAPQVQQALNNTLWVQIDMTEFDSASNSELAKHYNILGLPSILFFDLNGKELSNQRTTGFMGADEFAAHINSFF
ncbi:protein-disulfide reductase DsbD [Litorilituus lipolyticus]|uniref:Thiol:disulfide interchange protein DsbD n=1 Tax=Litorilituus lipolyticus TaxID=2491017 RepID=A0A502L472_9GAMM|nr:protein-disulfide reductase DsbD [Litorilituus lipolyticus]TPH15097.1 protein-disulfide reductase DsbD [Litorilituus lipolyticus]